MPNTKQIRYDDWSKGDWGDLSAYNAPAGSFSGSNVIVYDNGFIGPRAGLHENTYTGDPMQGNVYGIFLPGRIGKPVILFVDDHVFSTSEDNGELDIVADVATLDAVPVEPIVATWYDPNGDIYFTSPDDKVYRINWSTNTLLPLPVVDGIDSSGVQTVYLCRDRLYAAGDIPNNLGHRVYFSGAADFTNFVGDFFDVGYFNAIRGMVESQNSLNFSTLTSTNNIGSGVGWYALVGATPQGDLRRVNTQIAAGKQSEIVNADNGNFYYWTGWSTSNTDTPYLVQANGAKFNEEEFHHIKLEGQYRYGYYNAPDKTLIFVSDTNNKAWMRVNGVWTRHDFEVDVSGPVCPTEAGDSFLLAYGAPATDVVVYELLSQPDGPVAAGLFANPGDNSNSPINAFFELPAYQSEGKEVRVRRVLVDFLKFDLNHADTNTQMIVNVRTFGQYNLPTGTTDGDVTTSQTWSENQDLSGSLGTLDRFVARIGQQGKSQGFQVSITGIKGVAIRSITVEFDEDDMPDGRTL